MLKNKVDFKLINLAILIFIIYLMYQTGSLWIGILAKLWEVLEPLLIAFAIAYALYPLKRYFMKQKVPKGLAIFFIFLIFFGVFLFVIFLIAPVLVRELSNLFSSIIVFIKEISVDFDLNLGPLQSSLNDAFNTVLQNAGKYLSDGAISIINVSLSVVTQILIILSLMVYFLIDMDKIRHKVGRFSRRRSKKSYRYLAQIDIEMRNYLSGFLRIAIISFFEYGIVYMLIGHPNALLLAVLASVANLIPYFGGIINNIVAAITAFVISPALFIRTLIAFVFLSALDGYVINPMVYGKTNKVHPILVISSVFAGGVLFGILGIIISLPLAIFLITTIKFYKADIYEIIEDIKEEKKANE